MYFQINSKKQIMKAPSCLNSVVYAGKKCGNFDSDDAIPASNDLTDLSEADLSNLSSDAIRELADYIIPGISAPSRIPWP
jgi:hypothetical protein